MNNRKKHIPFNTTLLNYKYFLSQKLNLKKIISGLSMFFCLNGIGIAIANVIKLM